MLTASVKNMLVTSIDTTLETGVVPTQYIVIISTLRRQSDSDSWKLVSNVGSTLVRLLISVWDLRILFKYSSFCISSWFTFLFYILISTWCLHHSPNASIPLIQKNIFLNYGSMGKCYLIYGRLLIKIMVS